MNYGTVVGQFVASLLDTTPDGTPDSTPLGGMIIFKQNAPYLKNTKAEPNPQSIFEAPIVARLDDEGYLCTVDEAGELSRGVTLIATDDPDLNPVEWTWSVDYALTLKGKNIDGPNRHSILVGTDETVDLTVVSPVAASSGIPIVQGPKGEDGKPGTSFNLRGYVENYENLPVDPEHGDGWTANDTGHLYVWDVDGWVDAGSFRGPAGPSGTDGSDGQDGPAGKSAYQTAVDGGFTGSETEWLESLIGSEGPAGTDGIDGLNGSDGLSAYQIAVNSGFSGTETEWLDSLVGADGKDGLPGTDGLDGPPGVDGSDGLSAYQVAVAEGFTGTVEDWLISLTGPEGPEGPAGSDGLSAYQIAVQDGFSGTEQEWLDSLIGAAGTDGTAGADGADGKSAYEVAVASGFVGTESEWLQSLVGPEGSDGASGADGSDGLSAYEVAVASGFSGTESEWLASLVGPEGPAGADGADGQTGSDGLSAYQVAVQGGFIGTEQEWLDSLVGPEGPTGTSGSDGIDGDSAYEVAVASGFVGTEADWLASLIGPEGPEGPQGLEGPEGPANTLSVGTVETLPSPIEEDAVIADRITNGPLTVAALGVAINESVSGIYQPMSSLSGDIASATTFVPLNVEVLPTEYPEGTSHSYVETTFGLSPDWPASGALITIRPVGSRHVFQTLSGFLPNTDQVEVFTRQGAFSEDQTWNQWYDWDQMVKRRMIDNLLDDTGWITCPTQETASTDFYTQPPEHPQIRRIGKMVYLRGSVSSRSIKTLTVYDHVFTIPEGFRATVNYVARLGTSSGSHDGTSNINASTGYVGLRTSDSVSGYYKWDGTYWLID